MNDIDLSTTEEKHIEDIFSVVCRGSDGSLGDVNRLDIQRFFRSAPAAVRGLPSASLAHLYGLVDQRKTGALDRFQLVALLRGVALMVNGAVDVADVSAASLQRGDDGDGAGVVSLFFSDLVAGASPSGFKVPADLAAAASTAASSGSSANHKPVNLGPDPRAMRAEEFDHLSSLFQRLATGSPVAVLKAGRARALFRASGLTPGELARIWLLSDRDEDGRLTVEQFALAMWQISRRKLDRSFKLPAPLPDALVASARALATGVGSKSPATVAAAVRGDRKSTVASALARLVHQWTEDDDAAAVRSALGTPNDDDGRAPAAMAAAEAAAEAAQLSESKRGRKLSRAGGTGAQRAPTAADAADPFAGGPQADLFALDDPAPAAKTAKSDPFVAVDPFAVAAGQNEITVPPPPPDAAESLDLSVVQQTGVVEAERDMPLSPVGTPHDVAKTIEGLPKGVQLDVDGRVLLLKETLKKLNPAGQWQQRTFFLFNDLLIWTKPKLLSKHKLVYKGQIRLHGCELRSEANPALLTSRSASNVDPRTDFQMNRHDETELDKPKLYTLRAENHASKVRWVEMISRARARLANDSRGQQQPPDRNVANEKVPAASSPVAPPPPPADIDYDDDDSEGSEDEDSEGSEDDVSDDDKSDSDEHRKPLSRIDKSEFKVVETGAPPALESERFYRGELSKRADADAALGRMPVGGYFIRPSSRAGCFALSHHDAKHGPGHVLLFVAQNQAGKLLYALSADLRGCRETIQDLLRGLGFPRKCCCGWKGPAPDSRVGDGSRTLVRQGTVQALLTSSGGIGGSRSDSGEGSRSNIPSKAERRQRAGSLEPSQGIMKRLSERMGRDEATAVVSKLKTATVERVVTSSGSNVSAGSGSVVEIAPSGGEGRILSGPEMELFAKTFAKADADGDGFVPAADAVPIFTKSGLSKEDLAKVWQLSDADRDTRLNVIEFSVAMWLINIGRAGKPLPDVIPLALLTELRAHVSAGEPDLHAELEQQNRRLASTLSESDGKAPCPHCANSFPLVELPDHVEQCLETQRSVAQKLSKGSDFAASAPDHRQQTPQATNESGLQKTSSSRKKKKTGAAASDSVVESIQDVPAADAAQFLAHFQRASAGSGFVPAAQAAELLRRSGLPQADLALIWTLADEDRDSQLSALEFAVALRLVNWRRAGNDLPDRLPIELRQHLVTVCPGLVQQAAAETAANASHSPASAPPPGPDDSDNESDDDSESWSSGTGSDSDSDNDPFDPTMSANDHFIRGLKNLAVGRFSGAAKHVEITLKKLEPTKNGREIKMAASYKVSIRALRKARTCLAHSSALATGSDERMACDRRAAQLTAFAASQALKPTHRATCLRMACSRQLAVSNYASAASCQLALSKLSKLPPADVEEAKKRQQSIAQQGTADASPAHGYILPKKHHWLAEKLVPSSGPTGMQKCNVCSQYVQTSSAGSPCPVCGHGTMNDH